MNFYLTGWITSYGYGDRFVKLALHCYREGLSDRVAYSRLRSELRCISAPLHQESDTRLLARWRAKASSLVLVTNPMVAKPWMFPRLFKTYETNSSVTLVTDKAALTFYWRGKEGILGCIETEADMEGGLQLSTHVYATRKEEDALFEYAKKDWKDCLLK